jgi:hypothetical protein
MYKNLKKTYQWLKTRQTTCLEPCHVIHRLIMLSANSTNSSHRVVLVVELGLLL